MNFLRPVSKSHSITKEKRRSAFFAYFLPLSLAVVLCFGISFLVFFYRFFAVVESYAQVGTDLVQAGQLLEAQKFSRSFLFARQAAWKLEKAKLELSFLLQEPWSFLPYFKEKSSALTGVDDSLSLTLKTVARLALIGEKINVALAGELGPDFFSVSAPRRAEALSVLHQSLPQLAGLRAELSLARSAWPNNLKSLPGWSEVEDWKGLLAEKEERLRNILSWSDLFLSLSGYPNKSVFLVAVYDSNTSGIKNSNLKAYGILETKDGDLLNLNFYGVEEIEKISDRLGPSLHNLSNLDWRESLSSWPEFFTDLETTIRQRHRLLTEKNVGGSYPVFQGEFDGAFLVSSKFMGDLLDLYDGVELGERRYDSRDWLNLLRQDGGSQERERYRWSAASKLFWEFKNRFLSENGRGWKQLYLLVRRGAEDKSLVVFSRNAAANQTLKAAAATGELSDWSGDFLMLSDSFDSKISNVSRSLKYKVEERGGNLYAKLKINYACPGRSGKIVSAGQARIFIPTDSYLMNAKINDGVAEYEPDLRLLSGDGRAYLDVPLELKSGEIRSVYAEYVLPPTLSNKLRKEGYGLLLQKQIGQEVDEVEVELNFRRNIVNFFPRNFFVDKLGENRIQWKSDLDSDREFRVSF